MNYKKKKKIILLIVILLLIVLFIVIKIMNCHSSDGTDYESESSVNTDIINNSSTPDSSDMNDASNSLYNKEKNITNYELADDVVDDVADNVVDDTSCNSQFENIDGIEVKEWEHKYYDINNRLIDESLNEHIKSIETDGLDYRGDIITNGKMAKLISDLVMENVMEYSLSEWKLNCVYFDSESEVWLLNYTDNTDPEAVGGDVDIALSKKTGEIIKIWAND